MKKLPLLCFLSGSIGDALMALALCSEVAELNPGVRSTLFARRDYRLVADLAARVPSARIESARFTPLLAARLAVMLAHPWQIVSAWKNTHRSLTLLRAMFLLNPKTRLVRFNMNEPAHKRDAVAPYDWSKLVIDNFRILAQTAGLKTRPEGSPASLPIAAVIPKDFALNPGSYIVLHPFGSNHLKSLPHEEGRAILRSLISAFPQLSFVVTCGPQDGKTAAAFVEDLPRVKVATGLPILEVAGLIQNAALYIGVDTGVTHLAALMGKKMLALEHPTHPRWFPTYNPKTVMLLGDPSDTRDGLYTIPPERVCVEAGKMLG